MRIEWSKSGVSELGDGIVIKASPPNVFIVVRPFESLTALRELEGLCSPSFDPEALDGRP